MVLFGAVLAAASSCAFGFGIERPHDRFLNRLADLCGQAFEGRITTNEPAPAEDPFAGRRLVMHVRECGPPLGVRIPFHVGADRSRTWVLTWRERGLQLKHDHRHEDGSPDTLTMYGGDTIAEGTASRQEFPADAESKALFEREGLTASVQNVWAMEIKPGRRFTYELTRPDRVFRVEFDLTRAVPTPAPPWGAAPER